MKPRADYERLGAVSNGRRRALGGDAEHRRDVDGPSRLLGLGRLPVAIGNRAARPARPHALLGVHRIE
jgi:hypothetical protein